MQYNPVKPVSVGAGETTEAKYTPETQLYIGFDLTVLFFQSALALSHSRNSL